MAKSKKVQSNINSEKDIETFSKLFPTQSKILLTGGGKQFVERIGVEAIRQTVYSVMIGENVRTQTEFISRRRIAQISGAVIAMIANGYSSINGFEEKMSSLAVDYLKTVPKADNAQTWPARWLIGLTGKSDQNVLRGESSAYGGYIKDFDAAIKEAAEHCVAQLGDYNMTLGYLKGENNEEVIKLNWEGIAKLTTAIGAQTLTIRGSDKSMYGKLFERLILGALLTILGFKRVDPNTNKSTDKVFWLSDSKQNRESDATAIISAGNVARFDIGFIGKGNSEISKDKLSRFDKEIEVAGGKSSSTTFIVVDKLPNTSKTQDAADKIGAEIIQMSMQYWPKKLCERLAQRCGFQHEIKNIPDDGLNVYLKEKLTDIPLQDFLSDISIDELENMDNESDIVEENDETYG